MENFNLNPNLHYMVLGYNCYFLCVTNRVRGPVDNISCYSTDYIYKLCDKSYLNIVLSDENIQRVPNTTVFKINSLSLDIIHNKPDKEWKNQQIKRYANFRKFINNLQNSNDYYFLLYIINEESALKYKKALEDNGLMEKTIVFSHEEKYLELFKNKVLIDIDFELDSSKDREGWWFRPLANKIYEFFQTNGFTVTAYF